VDELFSDAATSLAKYPKIGKTGKVSGTCELILHESYRLVYEIDRDKAWVPALVYTARMWPPVKGYPRNTMSRLLERTDAAYPLPPEERDWVDDSPVGREWLNDEG